MAAAASGSIENSMYVYGYTPLSVFIIGAHCLRETEKEKQKYINDNNNNSNNNDKIYTIAMHYYANYVYALSSSRKLVAILTSSTWR